MGQDQLFKTLLEGMLQSFLELFFPEVAARLDFETLRFLDKEVFANVPEGDVRAVGAGTDSGDPLPRAAVQLLRRAPRSRFGSLHVDS